MILSAANEEELTQWIQALCLAAVESKVQLGKFIIHAINLISFSFLTLPDSDGGFSHSQSKDIFILCHFINQK